MKNTSKTKKIKNIIEYTIIFLVIFVNGFLIIQSFIKPDKSPSLFGIKAFVIVSGSMVPTIEVGDVVLVNNTTNVTQGDVIAFRRDNNIIVHRIAKDMHVNGKTMYQTKGDNNNVEDPLLVDTGSIEGIMIGKIPFIGKILMWLYNNLAIVIVVLIFIIIIKYFFIK